METNGKFYLGRQHDLKTGKTGQEPLLYDPDDLTTHAVVFGMTGSGKTGLCINLLEEAALQGIPALLIDPKGDITNALLHFPNLLPEDFEPWVNPDQARRAGKSIPEAAAETAAQWKKGLAEWDISPERLQTLSDAAAFAVYTPGSNAGLPVSILASLKAPKLDWGANKEIIREHIGSTVTALLGLVGFENIDPIKSREHILLANLFEAVWSAGRDLDLSELIVQIQNPPFKQLGVFEVDKFFPPADRAALAMRLNNILAAPGFAAWLEGQPLDIEGLLYTADGRPRHSVFTLSHLSDAERMFFVTLLYSAVETWMRGLSGTSSLQALVYFDEIHGYLPPVAEPPSKGPMLRLLKQARAFGVGQLLATQNPIDVDYKALSNAGTWFIGKLQTERDKERLLDGLEGAAQGSFKRAESDKLISALDKRVFLMHNVHNKKATVFHTRWAMNYLAGPITRAQIPALNQLAGAGGPTKSTAKAQDKTGKEANMQSSVNKPNIPNGVQELFLPAALSLEAAAEAGRRDLPADAKRLGLRYRPALLAQAQMRFFKPKFRLDVELRKAALVEEIPGRALRWEEFEIAAVEEKRLEARPTAEAEFSSLDGLLGDGAALKKLESDFADWVYRNGGIQVWANEALKLYAGPDLNEEQFLALCTKAAETRREAEVSAAKTKYQAKLKALDKKLAKEKRELVEDQQEVGARKLEEMGTHMENVLSLFGGRRRTLTTSLTKRRMTAKAQADVEETAASIADLEAEMQDMGEVIQNAMDAIHDRWDAVAGEINQLPVTPLKKDVYVSVFGIAWLPYHRVDLGGREVEIAAFETHQVAA